MDFFAILMFSNEENTRVKFYHVNPSLFPQPMHTDHLHEKNCHSPWSTYNPVHGLLPHNRSQKQTHFGFIQQKLLSNNTYVNDHLFNPLRVYVTRITNLLSAADIHTTSSNTSPSLQSPGTLSAHTDSVPQDLNVSMIEGWPVCRATTVICPWDLSPLQTHRCCVPKSSWSDGSRTGVAQCSCNK